MSECRIDILERKGRGVPRSCPRCGIGKCLKHSEAKVEQVINAAAIEHTEAKQMQTETMTDTYSSTPSNIDDLRRGVDVQMEYSDGAGFLAQLDSPRERFSFVVVGYEVPNAMREPLVGRMAAAAEEAVQGAESDARAATHDRT